METQYQDSKVKIGEEEWVLKYFPQVLHPKTKKYLKAARIPSKKEIWLSLNDASNKKLEMTDLTANLQKAILPLVIEDTKKKYGEEKTNEALRELGMKV